MSEDPAGARQAAVNAGQAEPRCLACGEPMAADQEWCLECGAARTTIRPPPDLRVALAIVAVVIAVVIVVLVIAL